MLDKDQIEAITLIISTIAPMVIALSVIVIYLIKEVI